MMPMLVDEAEIIVKGGHGGAGKVSFHKGRQKGPDGGNGGKGGDVYLKGTDDLTALSSLSVPKTFEAQNGQSGGSNRKFGQDGKNLTILIPVACEVLDKESANLLEIVRKDQEVLIAKGGLGGKGNFEFKSPTNTTPLYAQTGLDGEEKTLKITLKLIADFGLIGLPNVGKSSLLNELTSANVKVANYPFTTLEPNLGVFNKKILADIPGLIEGASLGKGLGIKFLKHIEKTGVLLHCLSCENKNVFQSYKTVREELKKYNPKLLEKKEIILLTKSDLVGQEELKNKENELKKFKRLILPVSIYNWDSLEKLKNLLI